MSCDMLWVSSSVKTCPLGCMDQDNRGRCITRHKDRESEKKWESKKGRKKERKKERESERERERMRKKFLLSNGVWFVVCGVLSDISSNSYSEFDEIHYKWKLRTVVSWSWEHLQSRHKGRDRETESQRDREIERQRTERQSQRETERDRHTRT